MVLVVPGINGILPGLRSIHYADRLIAELRHRGVPGPHIPILWPEAEWGVASVVALPFWRRRAERALDPYVREDLVLLSHSLGTELCRGWLVRTGRRPRLWVLAGSYDGLIGRSTRAFVPGFRPWPGQARAVSVHHPDDWWGGPIDGIPEIVLPPVPGAIQGHAYWDDPRFAEAIADLCRPVPTRRPATRENAENVGIPARHT